MNWSDVAKVASPVLGGALGGPAGAIVGKALAEFINSPNDPEAVKNAIVADPELAMKFETERLNSVLQFFIEENADRQNARNREIELAKSGHDDKMMRILAYATTCMFFLCILLLFIPNVNINLQEKEILFYLVGVLGSKYQSIIDYCFGSSYGSKIKDTLMKKL